MKCLPRLLRPHDVVECPLPPSGEVSADREEWDEVEVGRSTSPRRRRLRRWRSSGPWRGLDRLFLFLLAGGGKEIREPHYGCWILRLRRGMLDGDGIWI